MTIKETNSLGSQIMYCASSNIRIENPFRLVITSFGGKLQEKMSHYEGFSKWKLTAESKPYIDLFEKDKLVYLSSEAEDILETLEDDKVYIIGGLVDHNRLKGITHQQAVSQGIKTVRLPIGEHMEMSSRKVLTVNQVLEIMLHFRETNDWKKAFEKAIPQRKGAVAKNNKEEQDEEDEEDDINKEVKEEAKGEEQTDQMKEEEK
eukprot:TRINITY_DN8249_c0_g1_i1.p1 TRINITY_DN8249_c0_g1~~TRINITY_DN8249_c0_g1_i1.p1  ORF type:complete len:205 (-),score=64.44 TRINITY_DN8249_c0_g1_i1:13-627(-)